MTETDNLTPEEKHAIWQNNACFLYDRLVIQKLKWPSLVFQWLPFREDLLEDDAVKYQFLYSSHSSGSASLEHLYIAEVFSRLFEVVLPNLKNID